MLIFVFFVLAFFGNNADGANSTRLHRQHHSLLFIRWCGPCKLIEPIIERCAEKWEGKVDFVRYDVEGGNGREVKISMLMQKARIRKLPTLLLYHRGKIKATHSGLISYDELELFIADALHEKVHEDDIEGAKRGKISFGSSMDKDDYALGP